MDFDQVLEEIGEFGCYQRTNYLLICLPVMFAAANSLSYVFTAGTPAYRCLVPECEDIATTQLKQPWLPNATPGTTNAAGEFIPETCLRFRPNATSANVSDDGYCPKEQFQHNASERCFEWVYDAQERTIVQEWQLTCKENAWKLAFVGTMHFAGLVVGTAVSGYLADRFGRKIIFIVCIVFMAVTGIAQALTWDYNSFLIFAFLNAIGTSGVYPLAFIIGVEMVGRRKREMSAILLNYFYAVGEALLGVAAWWLHDWQLLQYALSVPALFFIVYYWVLPESVRFLIARKQREQAGRIIRRAAQINGKELSVALLANFRNAEYDNAVPEAMNTAAGSKAPSSIKNAPKDEIWLTLKEVCLSRTLLLRYSVMMYIWIINSVVYYGLSLNSTSLSGNKYLNFALVCLIEIPGYTMAWILLNKFGRRRSLSGSLFLCAITCVAGGYLTEGNDWAIITLFMLGKLGITSSFAIIYTNTAEMMPTLIRSGGVGVMSTTARFGAMLAPFVPLLADYYKPLPLLLFGSLAASAGLMALLLPETFRKRLPDTVAEAKMLGKTLTTKQAYDVADTTT